MRRHDANLGKIVRLESTPCVERTSFHLVDLEIELEDGTVLRLLLKDLGLKNLHETARRVKPGFLYEPLREIKTYQEILARHRLGTAHFYGAVVRPDEDRYWLFLEKVPGVRLSAGERRLRLAGCGPLAGTPAFPVPGENETLNRSAPLLQLRCRLLPAVARAGREVSIRRRLGRAVWESLADIYGRAIERLIRLPSTLIHGEFYASNILVEETREGCRICPVDWEMAAVGPGLIDLAALSSGAWAERERTEMAAAYHDALLSEGVARLPLRRFAPGPRRLPTPSRDPMVGMGARLVASAGECARLAGRGDRPGREDEDEMTGQTRVSADRA